LSLLARILSLRRCAIPPLFQQLARGDPPRGDDVYPLSAVAAIAMSIDPIPRSYGYRQGKCMVEGALRGQCTHDQRDCRSREEWLALCGAHPQAGLPGARHHNHRTNHHGRV